MDKGLDASKKVVHKAGEFIGNKTADASTKSNDDSIKNFQYQYSDNKNIRFKTSMLRSNLYDYSDA